MYPLGYENYGSLMCTPHNKQGTALSKPPQDSSLSKEAQGVQHLRLCWRASTYIYTVFVEVTLPIVTDNLPFARKLPPLGLCSAAP